MTTKNTLPRCRNCHERRQIPNAAAIKKFLIFDFKQILKIFPR